MKVLAETHFIENGILQKARRPLSQPAMELAASAYTTHALVCGGRSKNGFLIDLAHVVGEDLSPHKTAPMPEKRARHAVAARSNDEFFVVGGITEHPDGSLGLASNVLAYNLREDKWRSVAELPKRAAKLVAEVVGDKLFVIAGDTGITTSAGAPIAPARCRNDVQILDLKSGKWSSGRPKPVPETGVTSAVANSKIYVVSSENDKGVINALVEVYDVGSDRWEKVPDMPTPRTNVPCGFVGDKLVCVGGLGRNLRPLSVVESYDLASKKWKKGKAAAVSLADAAYFVIGSRLVMAGGRTL